jgi:ankyrin repeat protein
MGRYQCYNKEEKGRNPLHHASQNVHLDIVRLLIDSGATVDIRNGIQQTPLALASGKGKVEVGRFLIERGADMNARDNQGCAPLHLAARHGHLDMARMLLNHSADVNVQKDYLWSSLHLASHKSNLKACRFVDTAGRKRRPGQWQARNSALPVRAIWNGKVAISHLLINRGANRRTADGNGWTLLHVASYGGHLEVIKLSLCRGVDVDALNKANKKAAELALENGRFMHLWCMVYDATFLKLAEYVTLLCHFL